MDAKTAIDKQVSVIQSEGFKVVERRADGEGAIGVMSEGLQRAGCKVEIHAKSTGSAEIDVKIRQFKMMVRSTLVLPYLAVWGIIPLVVYFACSKTNMLPSRAIAHNYSPMEMSLGRAISIERSRRQTRCHGEALAFGSRHLRALEGCTYGL